MTFISYKAHAALAVCPLACFLLARFLFDFDFFFALEIALTKKKTTPHFSSPSRKHTIIRFLLKTVPITAETKCREDLIIISICFLLKATLLHLVLKIFLISNITSGWELILIKMENMSMAARLLFLWGWKKTGG